VFRRRRAREDEDELSPIDDTDDDEVTGTAEDSASDRDWRPGRPEGPWDVEDAPEDDLPRIDLGALQVPMPDGMELRVDVQDQVVVAATVVEGHSAMQVHAFAAPRSSGIWFDVRQEIADSLRQGGGEAEEADGVFGVELRARIPVEAPGQGRTLQPGRFLGVDGPRWFLRALLTGPAATDAVQAKRLEDVFRGTVVVRGGEAMAPRDLLPLRLPREAGVEHPPEEPARPGLEMLERGPEITETQ